MKKIVITTTSFAEYDRDCLEKFKSAGFEVVLNPYKRGADYKYRYITKTELLGLQRTFSLYTRFPESELGMIKKAEKFDAEGNGEFKKLTRLYYERFFK